jgi:hypothetical protein
MMQIWPYGRLIAKFQGQVNRPLGTGLQSLNKWVENEEKVRVNMPNMTIHTWITGSKEQLRMKKY